MRDVELYRHPGVDQLNFSSPIHKPLAYRRAHGTHVIDLACGYDAVTEDRADRPILAVQLPSDVTAHTSRPKLAPYFLQATLDHAVGR